MLKSTPVKVPAADVATLAPSFTTTETVQHESRSVNWHFRLSAMCQSVIYISLTELPHTKTSLQQTNVDLHQQAGSMATTIQR
jgi:hypothetical protein